MRKNQAWVVNSITTRLSKHGGYIDEIVFVNLESRELVKSWLDPLNRNYPQWNTVLANRDCGQIITGVKTSVKNLRTVINADSSPEILWVGTKEELADTLSEYWGITKPNEYQNLFE